MKYGDKPVPGSPFRVRAGPPYDASKVKVSGPGVEKAGIVAEEITKAVVDTTEAGIADLSGWLNMVKLVEESDESSFIHYYQKDCLRSHITISCSLFMMRMITAFVYDFISMYILS